MDDFFDDKDLKFSSKAALYFLSGFKISLVAALVFMPFYSRQQAILKGTSFSREYLKGITYSSSFMISVSCYLGSSRDLLK